MLLTAVACGLLAWYGVMVVAALSGLLCILTRFRRPPGPPDLAGASDWEPVSIIRPVKGIDPELELCLESSFLQNYPPGKLEVLFCVSDPADPAVPLLHRLAERHPLIPCEILVLAPGLETCGPNPKVKNLVKGFLRARHDLVWIMDLNVWASEHVLANSVRAMTGNLNCGRPVWRRARSVKLVHHVPLAMALGPAGAAGKGSLLDEMFMFTLHLKFYVSLNNLLVAPCVNGKSNLYRRSDLDYAVGRIPYQALAFFLDPAVVQLAREIAAKGPGHLMEFFAKYIGEDNMIGIALWEYCHGRTALTGDVVVQPLQALDRFNSVAEYWNRRVRWLRVRKYMVLAATLVEPTTESIICGLMGTTALLALGLCGWRFFAGHMLAWLLCDYVQFRLWRRNISTTPRGPPWLQDVACPQRTVVGWLRTWLLRETLALPIWLAAMAGHEINWRGKPFMIKKDLSVEEL